MSAMGITLKLGGMAIRLQGLAAPEWDAPGGAEATRGHWHRHAHAPPRGDGAPDRRGRHVKIVAFLDAG